MRFVLHTWWDSSQLAQGSKPPCPGGSAVSPLGDRRRRRLPSEVSGLSVASGRLAASNPYVRGVDPGRCRQQISSNRSAAVIPYYGGGEIAEDRGSEKRRSRMSPAAISCVGGRKTVRTGSRVGIERSAFGLVGFFLFRACVGFFFWCVR